MTASAPCSFCPSPTTTPISLAGLDHTLALMQCEHCGREWTSFSGPDDRRRIAKVIRPEQFTSVTMSRSK